MSRSQQDEDEARGSCANNKTPYLTHCVERNDVEVNKSQQSTTNQKQILVEEQLKKSSQKRKKVLWSNEKRNYFSKEELIKLYEKERHQPIDNPCQESQNEKFKTCINYRLDKRAFRRVNALIIS